MKLNPYFGRFGGQFVPEILIPALDQLEEAFIAAKDDPTFQQELHTLLTDYAGRPTPLTKCRNLTQGTKTTIYLKREDLVHGGAAGGGERERARSSASGPPHGQDPNHCRNRCRAARRCHRYRLCAAWIQVPRLYGRKRR